MGKCFSPQWNMRSVKRVTEFNFNENFSMGIPSYVSAVKWLGFQRQLFILTLAVVGIFSPAWGQFMENKGQFEREILYTKRIYSGNVIISQKGLNYLFYDNSKIQTLYETSHHAAANSDIKLKKFQSSSLNLKYQNILQEFIGGNINPASIVPDLEESHKTNFFLGNKSEKWASNVKSFHKLLIRDLYTNIDLELLSNGSELKYNFICHQGSNPENIKIKYTGAESLLLDQGKLIIKTALIQYSEVIPVSYLISKDSDKKSVPVEMRLEGNILSFKNIPVEFKQGLSTLVIDPKLVFSTYSGTTADNFGFTATYDDQGNLYAGGITTSPYIEIPNGRYPTTTGAFDEIYNGGSDQGSDYFFPCDITISKYSSDGKNLLYATYLGGESNEYPHSLVVDPSGNLCILGSTFSFSYPVSPNAHDPAKSAGSDIIITKLSANGDILLGSTYYGGSENDGLNESGSTKYFYADNFRGDIIVAPDGTIHAVMSTASEDIEIKDGFKNAMNRFTQQGIIFKFSANLSNLIWSSYIGGDGNAAAYSIDFDKNKDIFVSGGISGAGLGSTTGSLAPMYKGGRADGFIAKISKDGTQLLKATYFGTEKYDQIISLEIDYNDRIYVVGQTEGTIPIKGPVYNNGKSGQFVTMLDHDLNNVLLSTTFGTGDGLPDITINAFMVDECRRTFVSGWGGSASSKYFSSTKNLPLTSDAIQKQTDGSDFYIIVLGKEFKKLTYATYFGGTITNDHVDGGTSRWDKKGIIYQSVCSSCPQGMQVGPLSDFPTSKGAFAEVNISPRCSNAAFKFSVENLNLKPELKDTFFEVMAFDTLMFDYSISDPDEDTINIKFSAVQNIQNLFLNFPAPSQIVSSGTSRFAWSPNCSHLTQDTFRINAEAHDRGCPDFKFNSAQIKIKVLPPPVIPPPQTVCLLFKQNDWLELSWTAIPTSRYYKYTVLYKVFPNGTTVSLDTFRSMLDGKYLDKNVSNPRNMNYSYYLKVVNLCNEGGPISYKVSSVQENDSPIPSTQVVTATVINNKDVSIHWLPSKELDFGSYSLYRSLNTPTLNFQYVTSLGAINDTFYVDKTFNVQTESYCYAIAVNDDCGNSSKKSNIGCNIILKGISKPFYHELDWEPYRHWDAGVAEYVLERSVDTGSLRPIVSVLSNQLDFTDDKLDYDWGGYWYSIVATESFKGLSATSRSNSIYLIQPPLLHVPNAFTKNGDKLNDTWGFVPVFVKTYHMQVYNRWGEKVFDSENKKQDWEGNYLDETKGIEVFIWQVTYTGWDRSSHYQKGTVTVIK